MVGWLRRLMAARAGNGHSKEALSEAEAYRAQAMRATPAIERAARRVAALPDDEFAARIDRAFRRRPA